MYSTVHILRVESVESRCLNVQYSTLIMSLFYIYSTVSVDFICVFVCRDVSRWGVYHGMSWGMKSGWKWSQTQRWRRRRRRLRQRRKTRRLRPSLGAAVRVTKRNMTSLNGVQYINIKSRYFTMCTVYWLNCVESVETCYFNVQYSTLVVCRECRDLLL